MGSFKKRWEKFLYLGLWLILLFIAALEGSFGG